MQLLIVPNHLIRLYYLDNSAWDYLDNSAWDYLDNSAWAAANLAIGTLNGEQET